MTQRKLRIFNVLRLETQNKARAILLVFCSLMMAASLPAPASAHHAADCSDVLTPLSSFVTTGVNNNKSFYERVMNETGVPWELLAAIHYRETNFSHTNPSNGQGIFQFVNGEGGPYPAGAVSDDEFYRQLKFMAGKLQSDYVLRGNAPRERRQLVAGEQNIEIVKDTLFSYNGRAAAYRDQASHFGFNASVRPYEGSPYVMNRFDCPRARMGIITTDGGGVSGADTRYGAFTIFARLRGDAYWKGLWSAPFGGLGNSFILAKSDNPNDLRQWVMYGNLKQHIPNAQVLQAWGLQDRPLATLNWEAMEAFTTGPNLDILARITNSNEIYLIDNGKRYWIQSPTMMDAWKLNGRVISNVSTGLGGIVADGGPLTYSIKKEGTEALYMVDGVNGSGNVVLRQYLGPDVYKAWEGDTMPSNVLSANLFDTMDNAIGSSLNNTKITFNSNEYQVVSGQRLFLGTGVAPLYPGVAQSVTAHTFTRLLPTQEAVRYLRVASEPTVYLIDGGKKHPVGNASVLRAWAVGAEPPVNIVNSSYAALIPNGPGVMGYLGESSNGQLYIMDGRKIPVPANLDTAYRVGQAFRASDALLALQPTSETAQPLVKSFQHPHIYTLESGKRRYLSSSADVGLWSGESFTFTTASSYVVDSFAMGEYIGAYITDGSGSNYLVSGGNKLPVGAAAATDWGLASPAAVNNNTLTRLATGSALTGEKAKLDNRYFLVHHGTAASTTDSNLAGAWQLKDAPAVPKSLLNKVAQTELKRFAKSADSSDPRIFAADSGQLYHVVSPSLVWALGYDGGSLTTLAPSKINSAASATKFATPIVKTTSNQFYVIDNGTKRAFVDNAAKDQWTSNGTLPVLTLSDAWFNMFGDSPSLTKSIKGGEPAIYKVSGGTKQWLLSQTAYSPAYAPYTQTTDRLLDTLPSGSDIP